MTGDRRFNISVVIPCHNAAETIVDTLTSALKQSLTPSEIIIVDDGSTDASTQLLQPFAEQGQITLVRQTNAGVAAARNRGIAMATGEWVALLDADDFWYTDHLASMALRVSLDQPDLALVFAPVVFVGTNQVPTSKSRVTALSESGLEEIAIGGAIVSGSATMIRREVVMAAGGYDESLRARGAEGCEDLMLALKLASSHRAVCTGQYTVGYVQRPGSMSDNWRTMLRSRAIVAESFSATSLQPALARGRAELILSFVLRTIRNRDMPKAMTIMRHVLREERGSLAPLLRLLGSKSASRIMQSFARAPR